MLKGSITADYYVSCGMCQRQDWVDGRTEAQAVKVAQSASWHRTQKYGWVCPHCWVAKATQEAQEVKHVGDD